MQINPLTDWKTTQAGVESTEWMAVHPLMMNDDVLDLPIGLQPSSWSLPRHDYRSRVMY